MVNQQNGVPMVNQQNADKFWVLGDSNERTCHLHSSAEVPMVNQQNGVLMVNQQNADKFWVRGDSNEQTCHPHFGRIVTGGVHSRRAAASRVQEVGGSVTFTPHPPPAEKGGSSR